MSNNPEDKFAVVVPTDGSTNVMIATGIEQSGLFMKAMNYMRQLEEDVWTEEIFNDDGELVRTITHIPRDLKWMMEYMRKLASDVSRVTSQMEAKSTDQKLRVMDLFLNSPSVPQSTKEAFMEEALGRTMKATNSPTEDEARTFDLDENTDPDSLVNQLAEEMKKADRKNDPLADLKGADR